MMISNIKIKNVSYSYVNSTINDTTHKNTHFFSLLNLIELGHCLGERFVYSTVGKEKEKKTA